VVLRFVNLCAELEAQREITQVAGDLYRFQNNSHVSVFVVTPEGVAQSTRWTQTPPLG
jgi:hypothetical protein